MNKSIRLAALFALVLTVVLLVNVTVIQAFKEDEYAQNPLNARGFYEMQQIPRGNISAGGVVLAESHPNAEGNYERSYPAAPYAFSPVTGYLSPQYGASGIESSQNGILSGTDTSVLASRAFNFFGDKEERGANVELTLDPDLQELAFSQLSNSNYEGAAVALRPSTGEVLALASTPSYDANTIDENWEAINGDPGQPLISTATQQTLPPGSIFKIITTAAGLDNGYTPDSQLTGKSEITLPGTTTTLTNYGGQTCGGSDQVTLRTAFMLSCNTAFVEMGIDVGDEALRNAAQAFGVGETYDLGLQMSPGNLGDLADDASIGQTSIGQRDVTMSALQAAVMAGTVANEGKRMQPYVVKRVTEADLSEVSTTKPKEVTQAVSPEIAGSLQELMFASERNTAGYDGNGFASKTGTAEHGDGAAPHVWYVAYDPDKDVAVGIVVKNGGGFGTTATGGQVSAPIGRALLNAAQPGGEQ